MELAQKLRIYLAKRNIKKRDFARMIGKHHVSVSDYMRGHIKKPHIKTAKMIVEVTGGVITLKDMGYE